MKGSCSACGKSFTFDDSKFGDRTTLKVRCPSCKAVISLEKPAAAPAVAGSPPPAPPENPPSTQKMKRDQVVEGDEGGDILLHMPRDRRVSLAILSGPGSGQVIACEKARTVIGRSGADLTLDDEEVSRRHAMIEIREDRYFLKDLGSTNGTFVDERRIGEAEISDRTEFRVGGTQIMLIVTPLDDLG